MAQAAEMIKSMIESIERDGKELSVVQAQVVEVSGKMDASQKAMVTIGKIHQAMCFNPRTDTVSDAKN
jgi:F0F1-type ATP synthase alpha subunit